MRSNRKSWEGLKDVFEQFREKQQEIDSHRLIEGNQDASINSMYLSINDNFFKYENYLERKKKRLL